MQMSKKKREVMQLVKVRRVRENDHNQMSNLIVDDERNMTLEEAIKEVNEGKIKGLNPTRSEKESSYQENRPGNNQDNMQDDGPRS
ncbi:hypothetical protein DCMF_01870 [Candidatus Formimonas warabiya]|uniref:Uncharacterized protein n=2 Tax=Formimonas warabiya TaxID=1761012 RepID=A0A3G1KMP6_FORW1|nr:hypothetical protein DCMF_01870 [Candidatus Formimonas warabiya]